ncbi:UDP-glucose,sterol transferase [Colletotrichum orchidophilum]|uniref:UDP-glucose,sterol transferase n=1 Tax=Colletotrichum orchidophilum TaxID=1209926 RepID=A0A1G4BLR2_9PEZI|nr:UDP-glucose,sterol transferase [Colletotrichum orchidophilum]OHF02410.1 UDP-glucose,sterol transferase [Colletotrichum orchidophilum]
MQSHGERSVVIYYRRTSDSAENLMRNATDGLLVDIPLAVSEGLRAVLNLHGEPVRKHDAVKRFRSGVSVAGKTFCQDMKGGLTEIFIHTYTGKKEQGAPGAAKGFGMDVVSLVTKSTASTFGLVSYPAQGIYRSIWTASYADTRSSIEDQKHGLHEPELEDGSRGY